MIFRERLHDLRSINMATTCKVYKVNPDGKRGEYLRTQESTMLKPWNQRKRGKREKNTNKTD